MNRRPWAGHSGTALTVLTLLLGCGGEAAAPTDAGERQVDGLLVSSPFRAGEPSSVASVAYVSMVPGTVPKGASINVRNRNNGAITSALVVNGGLDPIAVGAIADDDLSIIVTDSTGLVTTSTQTVKQRRPPRVIRTQPIRGSVDVPLNVRIAVVFSAPIDPATVDSGALTLLQNGKPVDGTSSLSTDGLSLSWNPRSLLAATTSYMLIVSRSLRDLNGLAVSEVEPVGFRTGTGAIRISVSTTGLDRQVDHFLILVGDRSWTTGDSAAATAGGLAPGTHSVALPTLAEATGGLRRNCWVDGEATRQVAVGSGETAQVVFNVQCTAEPKVRISVATSGTEADRDGYEVVLEGPWEAEPHTSVIGTPTSGESAPMAIPPGTYDIQVRGMAGNCHATGPVFRRVSILDPMILPLAVRCSSSRQMAYVVGDGVPSEIMLGTTTSPVPVRLTSNAVADSNPSWSPNGRQIAFTSDRTGNGDIYVMDADGSNVRRITSAESVEFQPTWSPDGQRIAFVSRRSRNDDIYVVQADGSNEQRLTTEQGADTEPAWSPDGRIAFVSNRQGVLSTYTMDADGSNVRLVVLNGRSPAWSPLGDRIAVSRYFYSENTPMTWETFTVVVVNPDGSGETRLDASESFPASSGISWGPEGRIAFIAPVNDNGFYPTMIITGIQPDGTGVNRLISGDAREPAWRP